MAVVSPTPISALPSAPSAASPASFDTLADAFIGALPTFRTETNAAASNVYNNAVDAAANATTASTSASTASAAATAAAASASAVAWVSATVYAVGNARYSLINLKTYRCKAVTTTGDVTDPSIDSVHWTPVIPESAAAIMYTATLFGVF